MKKRRLSPLAVAVLVFAFILTACGGSGSQPAGDAEVGQAADDGNVYEFKLALVNADMYLMEGFPARVEEKTGGRVRITLYDLSNLGTASDALAMLRNGTVEMVFNAAAQTAGEFPVADIIQVPFLAANPSTCSEIMYGLYYAGYLDEFYNDTVPLFFAPTDMQMLGMKTKKVDSMETFKGLKLRAVSGIAVNMIEAFGSSAVAMPLTDVYLSLDRGVIDGALSSPHLMRVNALYDTLDYLMRYPIHGGWLYCMMNQDVYGGLPADLKLALKEAAEEQRYQILNAVQNTYAEGIKACEEGGMQIYDVSDEFKAQLREATMPLRDTFVADLTAMGYDGAAIMELAEGIVGRCEYNLK